MLIHLVQIKCVYFSFHARLSLFFRFFLESKQNQNFSLLQLIRFIFFFFYLNVSVRVVCHRRHYYTETTKNFCFFFSNNFEQFLYFNFLRFFSLLCRKHRNFRVEKKNKCFCQICSMPSTNTT